ncbi:MAG: indole-3-glycerol-phosphate synthase [Candidatus Bathyarchaeota archaeon]|nr:indole-3-glycerol-phosphate synthase [Candidatus Bathyarchaeota archaeon]
MSDFMDTLALDAKKTVTSGYYQTALTAQQKPLSLKQAIQQCSGNAVITEIKSASPSLGTIRTEINPKEVAKTMQQAGAVGISVLTEPKHFNGSLNTLLQAREAANLPILMKDIIISPVQLETAVKIGANAALLIMGVFERGYGEKTLENMIALAHELGLEVLLEAHNQEEFNRAVKTEADLVGINNRDLSTLKIDLTTTQQILKKGKYYKTVVSESGIKTPADLQFIRSCGADAFLIGSSIMLTEDIESKIREFVEA